MTPHPPPPEGEITVVHTSGPPHWSEHSEIVSRSELARLRRIEAERAALAERALVVLDNAHYIIDHCSQGATPAALAWFAQFAELRAALEAKP